MIVVALLLPWLALLLRGYIFQALLCLVLQLTLLGWIPAAIWAVVIIHNDAQEQRNRALMMQVLRGR
jgi:uncharacterized membrane protein YqaE (UPF0057 family)